jgi:hypothetical protein
MAKMAPTLGRVLFSTDLKLAAITILDNPGVQIDLQVLHRFQSLVASNASARYSGSHTIGCVPSHVPSNHLTKP